MGGEEPQDSEEDMEMGGQDKAALLDGHQASNGDVAMDNSSSMATKQVSAAGDDAIDTSGGANDASATPSGVSAPQP